MSAASGMREELVRQAARDDDPDRYVAALLAPRACRDDLIALAAFAGAVLKIPYQVSEPQIGEIRVAWWREALLDPALSASTGNPVADVFSDVFRRRRLDGDALDVLLARIVDRLYAAPGDDAAALSRDIDATQGTLFGFARKIIGGEAVEPRQGEAFGAGVQAYGLAKACLMLPYDLAGGRLPFAGEASYGDGNWNAAVAAVRSRAYGQLRDFRSAQRATLVADFTALLPVALVEPYFEALSGTKHDPARDIAEISPLARAWWLAKSRVLGRI